jgi:hypothetical protein
LAAAEDWGVYAVHFPDAVFDFLEGQLGEAANLNLSFLQMSNWLGNNFMKSGVRTGPSLVLELQYLEEIGVPVAKVPR